MRCSTPLTHRSLLTRPLFVKEEWSESEYYRDRLPQEGAPDRTGTAVVLSGRRAGRWHEVARVCASGGSASWP
ncbi:hypothetical protein ACZ91_19015 [Streptomyces regensis]|nr:hypothetical protein ACZ91_19015 [Streptomyces regensis]KOG75410.1 hypothetical protein ADK77_02230 [Streptomyces antibioticus]